MIPLPLAEVAAVVGGTLHDADGTETVTAPAVVDNRLVEPGGLFAAFAGARSDGHDHAAAAVAAGAAGVLASRSVGVPAVVVDDVQRALQDLARHVLGVRREAAPLTVVAITGSQGKTSAKDMLARVLGDHAPTVATHGSFNNELGLPLTVLRVEESTRHLVLEMGARGIGHLAELCAIARPDVSLVLNVGVAHLGEFGSREAIAQAKGELVEALTEDGTAVLNADDALVSAMAHRTRARVTTFGRGEADVRLGEVALDALGRPSFDLVHDGDTEHVALQLLGGHHAGNAAAVTATALTAGVPFDRVCASLREITALSKWRMELVEPLPGVRILNDAYNANPDSMAAALRTLAQIGERTGDPTYAVLGAMRELGETSAHEHRRIGELAADLGLTGLVGVGEESADILAGARDADRSWDAPLLARDVQDAAAAVRDDVGSGPAVILVKASRGAALERVVDLLVSSYEGERA